MNLLDLIHEHRVLMHQIGGLQRRSSAQMQAMQAREAAWQTEALRLRAELVLLRTSIFWGLGVVMALRRPGAVRTRSRVTSVWADAPQAQAVICQTGCVGHAHPWLAEDGQCRRSGQTCDRLPQDAAPTATAVQPLRS